MRAIKQRPFAFSCCIFLLSSFVLFFLPIIPKIIILSISTLSTLFLIPQIKKKRFIPLFILPPIIIACISSIIFFNLNYKNILTYSEKQCNAEFIVTDKTSGSQTSYTIHISKINGQASDFSADLYIEDNLDLALFSSHKATLKFYKKDSSEYGFSSALSYISKGVYLSAYPTGDITDNNQTVKIFPYYYFKKANDFFSNTLSKFISSEENALCKALLLGNKNELSSDTVYNFRLLGLSHMLAVSGLHLSILIGSFNKILEKINIAKKKRYVILIASTFLYAGLTGFSSSVKRASIMLILYYISFLLSKNHDSVTALCSSVALICLISPNSLFDIGLWLSFFSTYGILVAALPISEKLSDFTKSTDNRLLKLPIKLLSALIFGIIPIMFSLPIIWLSFGELAVLSPITNIIFTPLLLGIMYTTPFLMFLSAVPFIPLPIAYITSLCTNIMLKLSNSLSKNAPIISLKYNFMPYLIALFIMALVVISLSNTKKAYIYFIPFVCLITLFSFGAKISNNISKGEQTLNFSTSQSGDSFLLISNNKGILCDISGSSYKNAKMCEYYLKENRLTKLDGYIVTDYTANGPDTLKQLLSTTKIQKLYLPKSLTYDETLLKDKYITFADAEGLKTEFYNQTTGQDIEFYGVTIHIKNVSIPTANYPDSICVSFSSDKKEINYIGLGSYRETIGKKYLTSLFPNSDNFIFGSYGKESSMPVTSLLLQKNKTLYFTSEDVFKLYSKTVPKSAAISYIDRNLTFVLTD